MDKVKSPEENSRQNLGQQIQEALKELEILNEERVILKNATDLEEMERRIVAATDKLAGLMTARKIQQTIDSSECGTEAAKLVGSHPKKFKNQGPRKVKIKMARGESVEIEAPYFSRKGKKKKKTKRAGFYPSLMLLGIYDRCSPCLASEVCIMAVALSSFEEASDIMKERGVEIGVNTIRNIAKRFSARARLEKLCEQHIDQDSFKGGRIVVSTDGGRVRIRKDKRGPKTKKGRTRYTTEWKEPKVLTIYAIGLDGKMDRKIQPFLDGTMEGPDSVFGIIRYYLSRLGIDETTRLLFVADGARWIWNRVGTLMESLGLNSNQYYELVDFYHAVEHLSKVADLRKGWSKEERQRWIKKQRGLLLKGQVEKVIESVKKICRGRNSKEIRRERNYFIRNSKRMNYRKLKEANWPIGSGAVESAVRRIINLRFKGASIYWLKETVEAMIRLRAFFKAGRWQLIKKLSFSCHLDALA